MSPNCIPRPTRELSISVSGRRRWSPAAAKRLPDIPPLPPNAETLLKARVLSTSFAVPLPELPCLAHSTLASPTPLSPCPLSPYPPKPSRTPEDYPRPSPFALPLESSLASPTPLSPRPLPPHPLKFPEGPGIVDALGSFPSRAPLPRPLYSLLAHSTLASAAVTTPAETLPNARELSMSFALPLESSLPSPTPLSPRPLLPPPFGGGRKS
ncbi:uncharacterized protein [Penaeus vannamei]|uniref:uncharacterized protein n=1 Tax=Penaeus vannamei TaxID=6689 RepID=UPI00387F9033